MEIIKNSVKAILFDMDGTIIKSESCWDKAVNSLVYRRGLAANDGDQLAMLRAKLGGNLEAHVAALKEQYNLNEPVDQLIEEACQQAHLLLSSNVAFIDGFEPFHTQLQHQQIKTGLATNCGLETLRMLAKNMCFSKFFGSHWYSAEQVAAHKPDPAIFLHTARQLDVDPAECIVFEDSLVGFAAAKAAGMRCIAVRNSDNASMLDQVDGSIASYHDAHAELVRLVKMHGKSLPQPTTSV